MTTECLPKHCPLQDGPRSAAWPKVTLWREKLYTDLVGLKRTVALMKDVGRKRLMKK